jgi:ectoine hydroxylase-related dioxygenase (phytanoyl-CoA dioxygenase family)
METLTGTGELGSDGWHRIPNLLPGWACTLVLPWLDRAAERANHEVGLQAQFEDVTLSDGRIATDVRIVRRLRRLLWNDFEFWYNLLRETQVLSAGARLLRARIPNASPGLVGHTAFIKAAVVGRAIGLHQDQYLWRNQWPGAITMWISLDRCDAHNGALHLCPGSHQYGLLPHEDVDGFPAPVIPLASCEAFPPRLVPTEPGDAVVWDRHMIHGSGPNHSGQRRRAMALVFADTANPGFHADDLLLLEDREAHSGFSLVKTAHI